MSIDQIGIGSIYFNRFRKTGYIHYGISCRIGCIFEGIFNIQRIIIVIINAIGFRVSKSHAIGVIGQFCFIKNIICDRSGTGAFFMEKQGIGI